MIMKGGSLEPPFLLPWLRKRHQANSLNLKTTFFAPLRMLCVAMLRYLREIFHAEFAEVSQSSRRISLNFKTTLLAPLRVLCVLCEKVFQIKVVD